LQPARNSPRRCRPSASWARRRSCHGRNGQRLAYALDSEREQAIASGCDEFDAKPIDFEALVATIRRLVANPK
jgi:hypothetical protein